MLSISWLEVAVAFHGYQRLSLSSYPGRPEIEHDLDLWYNPTNENYLRIVRALNKMGIDTGELEKLIFNPETTFLRVPFDIFKVDFLPHLQGIDSFSKCYKSAQKVELDGNEIRIVGYEDLITSKEVSGRDIDRIDILELKGLHKDQGKK